VGRDDTGEGMIKELVKQTEFNPGVAGIFTNPFYFSRKGLYENISRLSPRITGKVLDIGCGSKPYQHVFKGTEYVGLELKGSNRDADYYYDGIQFPFKDGEFNAVLCSQVLEHVFTPSIFLSEIHRVLKDGGLFLLTVPFVWDEHEQPYDYARYSSFGLHHLLTQNGFDIIEHHKSMNDARCIFQMMNAYFYKVSVPLAYILSPFINLIGELCGLLLPKNDDLYLDNIILARRAKDV
jgi:SAM-dependent methyltransferase